MLYNTGCPIRYLNRITTKEFRKLEKFRINKLDTNKFVVNIGDQTTKIYRKNIPYW